MKQLKVSVFLFTVILILSSTLFAQEKGMAYLGVFLENISPDDYPKIDLEQNYGILISKVVPDSPADNAGLMSKDVLLELNGDKIFTRGQFTKMLTNYAPGDKVKLKIFREGKIHKMKLALGERKLPQIKKKAYLGVYPANLSEEAKQKASYDKNYGILIKEVVEDGPAAKSGLKENTILMSINGDKIYTVDQLKTMLAAFEPGNRLELEIFMEGKEQTVDLILGEKSILDSFDFEGNFNFSFDKPENVFVYRYNTDNDKWIGVMLQVVESKKDEKKKAIVTIEEVIAETPAEKAGLQPGDIILKVNGKEVESLETIRGEINNTEIGDKIELEISRDGEMLNCECEVAERDAEHRYEKMDISVDDGEITIWVNGEKKVLSDLQDIITIQKDDFDEFYQDKFEEAMEKAQEKLENLDEFEFHFEKNGAI